MMANITDTPEFAMTEEEGETFLNAGKNVLRHYSVEATQKTLDWIAFGGVAMMIYGTRITALMKRKRDEQAPKKPGQQGNVVHFAGGLHSTNPDDFIGGAAE